MKLLEIQKLINVNTFRPTKNQLLVLTNIDQLLQQTDFITKQDALNISPKQMSDDTTPPTRQNLNQAFNFLYNAKLILIGNDDKVLLTPIGKKILDKNKSMSTDDTQSDDTPQIDDVNLTDEEPIDVTNRIK